MTAIEWKAYGYVGGVATELDDIQNVSITMGRVQIQDPFRANLATIRGRNPQNLISLDIGDDIYIEATSPFDTEIIYRGQVANFRVQYGKTQNEDMWTLDLEDILAKAGRAYTTSTFSWSAGDLTDTAASAACTDCGLTLVNAKTGLSYTSAGSSTVSAQSLPNTNLLDILNRLAATEQGRLVQYQWQLGWINRADLGQFDSPISFTDGSLLSTTVYEAQFDAVDFSSLADSFYDSVLIEPAGLTAQLSGTGDRRFVLDTYDETTAQAQNLADYVLATLDVNTAVPFKISCVDVAQANPSLEAFLPLAVEGVRAELILRGTRYQLWIEGFTVSAQPGMTRVTFNVVSSEAQNFFILDSPVFGVLDSSRLGF